MVDDKINYQLKVQYLLAQLKEGSEFLENQTESLSGIWNHFRGKVCTFYETRWTKSVKQVGLPKNLLSLHQPLFNADITTAGIRVIWKRGR